MLDFVYEPERTPSTADQAPRGRGRIPNRQRAPTIWNDWLEAFLTEERDAKGRRARTLELHAERLSLMRRALDVVGAPTDPRVLTRAHIVAAIVYMRQSGRQPRTINLKLQSLRQLFAFAVADGRCQGNPVASVPRQRVPDEPPRALHDDELVRVLQTPNPDTFVGTRDHVMMLLMLDTGLRLGEALRLRLDDLDLPHRAVHVSEESKTHGFRTSRSWAGRRKAAAQRGDRQGAFGAQHRAFTDPFGPAWPAVAGRAPCARIRRLMVPIRDPA